MSATTFVEGRVMGAMATFQTVIEEFAPLFGLSFSIFALKGFRLSHSRRWVGGLWRHLLDILLSSLVGAFLIVGFCIMVMSVRPELDIVAIIGLAIFLSVGGMTLVDSIVFKYFGVHVLDPQLDVRGKLEVERKEEEK